MLAINSGAGGDKAFDDTMEPLLPELLDAAAVAQVERIKYDEMVKDSRSHFGGHQSRLLILCHLGTGCDSNVTHTIPSHR